tara:strand:- start:185 stop:1153 length:969 start_codon:yes stop_codon:yes gene_type:complete
MFSFIIPFQKPNKYLYETLNVFNSDKKFLKKFELILLPDNNFKLLKIYQFSYKIVPTGKISPPLKRDIGVKYSNYEILCFIDEDSYISKNWFKECQKSYSESNVVCVVGPGITPHSDPFFARIISTFFSSRLFSLFPERFLVFKKKMKVRDWPSVNFTIKKKSFLSVNGFSTNIWPGEDTLLCNKLTVQGIDIHYNGEMFVFHHRRNSIRSFIKQLFRYGYYRGKLFKDLKISSQYSFYLSFILILSAMFLFLIFDLNIYFSMFFLFFYYLSGVTESLIRTKSILSLCNFFLAPIGQISYLFGFVKGFFKIKTEIENPSLGR